jgi:hypothetical protein
LTIASLFVLQLLSKTVLAGALPPPGYICYWNCINSGGTHRECLNSCPSWDVQSFEDANPLIEHPEKPLGHAKKEGQVFPTMAIVNGGVCFSNAN